MRNAKEFSILVLLNKNNVLKKWYVFKCLDTNYKIKDEIVFIYIAYTNVFQFRIMSWCKTLNDKTV